MQCECRKDRNDDCEGGGVSADHYWCIGIAEFAAVVSVTDGDGGLDELLAAFNDDRNAGSDDAVARYVLCRFEHGHVFDTQHRSGAVWFCHDYFEQADWTLAGEGFG